MAKKLSERLQILVELKRNNRLDQISEQEILEIYDNLPQNLLSREIDILKKGQISNINTIIGYSFNQEELQNYYNFTTQLFREINQASLSSKFDIYINTFRGLSIEFIEEVFAICMAFEKLNYAGKHHVIYDYIRTDERYLAYQARKNNLPFSQKNTKPSKDLLPINSYFQSFQIQNFFSLKNLEISDLGDKKEIYILGENGDGKTLLLQALTIAAQWHRIENDQNFGKTGEIWELAQKSDLKFTLQDSENNIYTEKQEKAAYIRNFFAYGVNRRAAQDAESADNYGFLSLFSDQSVLKHPVSLLKEIDRLESKKINRYLPLEKLKEIISHLVSESGDFQIDTDGEEIVFWERGAKLDYKQLSEGYRSVMTWVMDLIFHLSENQPHAQNTEDFTGIVLVDEVSLHLHPKWEYELPKKLRTWFPNIQFIFTTHSPITVLGASEDAVFFKLYKENGETKISDPLQTADIQNLMLNSIITSPLFFLESARMHSFENQKPLDTSPDYFYYQIYELVKQEVAELKKSGKVYFSPESIKEMIQKALSTVQKAQ